MASQQPIDIDKLFQLLGIATYQKGMLEIENAKLKEDIQRKVQKPKDA